MKLRKVIILVIITCSYQVKSQTFDVIHQEIKVQPIWEEEILSGSTTLGLVFLTNSRTLSLSSKELSIEMIKSSDDVKLNFDEDSVRSRILIQLDRRYKEGEELSITIVYKTNWVNETDPTNIWGSLGEGVRFFEPSTTEPKRQKQIWSVGEPSGNQLWFPGSSDNSDFRTTDLFFTVEKPLQVISNGDLAAAVDNGDGTRTFHWKTTMPYPTHLTSAVVGKYLPVTQEYEDIEIISFCYPHEADATAATVERLPDMIKFYSDVTGVKYPYPRYSQVFVQEFSGWQGNMMTSTITENMVDDWVTHKDFRWLWDIVESEALASQWFGVNIVPAAWEDVWLSKGLSRHLSGLYNEYKNGKEEYLSYQLSPQQTTYLNDWNAGNAVPIVNPEYQDVANFVRSNYPYQHGASILHHLRKEVGDEIWFRILRNFSKGFTGKIARTSDFKSVVNEESDRDMGWFFDQWVHTIGHPIFEVTKSWEEERKELTISVDQVQQLDTLQTNFRTTRFFKGKMLIELDNQVEEIHIEPSKNNTYTFNLASEPRFVNFDFEDSWVKEERFEKSASEWTNQLLHSKDILARIAALSKLGGIASQESDQDEEVQNIYAAMRAIILSSKSYWRLKMLTLWQLQGLLVRNGQLVLDKATEEMLIAVIETEQSWVKSSAVWFLGMTQDPKYSDIYIDLFDDWSDRVTNAAAIALGKTKDPRAYDLLIELKDKPSWKNQSLISSLNGLQWLGDSRGAELALESIRNNEAKHWTLSTPIWDHRLAAGNTLNALGEQEKGYDFIFVQLQAAIEENDLNDVLYNTLQVANLGDPRGKEVFRILKARYKEDSKALGAIKSYEAQFLNNISSAH